MGECVLKEKRESMLHRSGDLYETLNSPLSPAHGNESLNGAASTRLTLGNRESYDRICIGPIERRTIVTINRFDCFRIDSVRSTASC